MPFAYVQDLNPLGWRPGSTVATCGAMLVGPGVPPFRAAVICLIANTSPVAYGGLGTPIMTLGGTAGLPADTLSIMAGHQLPILSCLIPLYMVKCMCSWRETLAIWPALLVGGGSFAAFQFVFATAHAYGLPPIWFMTDIGGALFSMACLALFLRFVWKPRNEWRFPAGADGGRPSGPEPHDPQVEHAKEEAALLLEPALRDPKPAAPAELPLTPGRLLLAWSPWLIMAACLVGSGLLRSAEKNGPVDLGSVSSYYEFPI